MGTLYDVRVYDHVELVRPGHDPVRLRVVSAQRRTWTRKDGMPYPRRLYMGQTVRPVTDSEDEVWR